MSASLTGLTPGAVYHYRLTATNSGGTAQTADATFRTSDPGGIMALWQQTYTGPASGNDAGLAVAADAAGNVAVTGRRRAANDDAYAAKYSTSGALI